MARLKPRLLDLFCGAGGSAVGYSRAGFEVVGVDLVAQPHYPFEFVRADALEVLACLNDPDAAEHYEDWLPATKLILPFAAIHASPPCQRFSDLAKRNGNGHEWPDWITPLRPLLETTGLPWVIENVEGAPLVDPIVLCGTMFPELRVLRHRLFESSVPLLAPPHGAHPLVFTHDKRKFHYGKLNQDTAFVSVNGGGNCSVKNKRAAMGVPWMTGAEANQAIPPAYAEYVGHQLIDQLTNQRRPDMARINAHSTTAPRLGAYRDCDATDGGSE